VGLQIGFNVSIYLYIHVSGGKDGNPHGISFLMKGVNQVAQDRARGQVRQVRRWRRKAMVDGVEYAVFRRTWAEMPDEWMRPSEAPPPWELLVALDPNDGEYEVSWHAHVGRPEVEDGDDPGDVGDAGEQTEPGPEGDDREGVEAEMEVEVGEQRSECFLVEPLGSDDPDSVLVHVSIDHTAANAEGEVGARGLALVTAQCLVPAAVEVREDERRVLVTLLCLVYRSGNPDASLVVAEPSPDIHLFYHQPELELDEARMSATLRLAGGMLPEPEHTEKRHQDRMPPLPRPRLTGHGTEGEPGEGPGEERDGGGQRGSDRRRLN
jgi:hypothetical protein